MKESIPADLFGSALLDGWCGPKESRCGFCGSGDIRLSCSYCGDSTYDHTCNDGCRVCGGAPVLVLPLARPECRLRVAAVLAAGERCRSCGGAATVACGTGGSEVPCLRCTDGYLRQPAPCWHLLPQSEVGPEGLPPELAPHAPELVACHVALVLAGRPGIVGVLDKWGEERWVWFRNGLEGHQRVWVYKTADDVEDGGDGWALGRPSKATPKGPETGDAGRACADAAALAHGYALRNPDGLVCPWPETP